MKTKLKNDEKIVLEIRLHWLTLCMPVLIALVLMVVGKIIGGYGLLLSLTGVLIVAYFLIARQNNVWVVTNFRIVDEKGVLSSNSKESPLEKINNVSYHQSLWGKIFNFGSVQIQTAAEIGATTVNMLEKPKLLKDTITQMQEEYKQYQIKKQAAELANAIITSQKKEGTDIAEELEKLYALKEKGILTEEEYAAQKAKILNS
jgi:uncharacterized membrane protein YdbT with pleckstrin-like domain